MRQIPVLLLTLYGLLVLAREAIGQSGGLVAQQAYLKASNTGPGDEFGQLVAISGNTLVVGAWVEDSSATGVDGDQSDNGAESSGAAYVFVRDATGWSQQAYLKASNTDAHDYFGGAVAVSGDTVVIGAQWEDSGATGVNGDQSDNSAPGAGAAYVFVRSGTSWSQQAYLKASNTEFSDNFGCSVAVSGDTVVVGAAFEDSSATGVDGDQSDNSASGAGAAYVFKRTGTSWAQQAYLKASNAEANDLFGTSVSVSRETVAVGARLEASSATGVDGDQLDNSATWSGAAYVFVRNAVVWSQQAYLKASNTGPSDQFGYALSLSGNTVVVGAYAEDSSAIGVDGDEGDNSAPESGAAYVFVRKGTDWRHQAYLKASNTGADDSFGQSVSVSGNTVVVGAAGEDSDATGVDGDQDDNSAPNAGAAYVFVRTGPHWHPHAYLKASNTAAFDDFGEGAAVSGDIVVGGSEGEDSKATGVDGSQGDNGAPGSGAAYAFDLDLDAWTDLGSGLAGSTGVPFLVGTGTLVAGSPCSLGLSNANPSSACMLNASLASTPVPFKGGTLVAFPPFLNLSLVTQPDGTLTLPFHGPAGLPPGTLLWFQFAIADAAAIKQVSLSNALKATTP